jgi:3-deoxy-D-manno-octulosonate 8-phosphate phosphatase (KDO 8-P phosphatase)
MKIHEIRQKAQAIRLVIFDVDGVLTDGGLFFGEGGQEYKMFHSRDGHGMAMLLQTGVQIAIITGSHSPVVSARMARLGIQHVYLGRQDKHAAYQQVKTHLALQDAEIAYVGDDVIDLPVMSCVGLSIAVQDAHPLVQRCAHWQTTHGGGRGAVREVCEMIMEAQDTLASLLESYLAPR